MLVARSRHIEPLLSDLRRHFDDRHVFIGARARAFTTRFTGARSERGATAIAVAMLPAHTIVLDGHLSSHGI